jgi:hypothetical protein
MVTLKPDGLDQGKKPELIRSVKRNNRKVGTAELTEDMGPADTDLS